MSNEDSQWHVLMSIAAATNQLENQQIVRPMLETVIMATTAIANSRGYSYFEKSPLIFSLVPLMPLLMSKREYEFYKSLLVPPFFPQRMILIIVGRGINFRRVVCGLFILIEN